MYIRTREEREKEKTGTERKRKNILKDYYSPFTSS